MKKSIIISTILFFFNSTYCQTNSFEFDIHGKTIQYFRKIEKQLGSKIYKLSANFLSNRNVAQPEVYIRKESGLPDLLVYYTFYLSDSTISEILYEWDVYNFDKKDNNQKTIQFQKKLINKYESVTNLINSKFGKGEIEGNINDLKNIKLEQGLKRKDTWIISDSLKIHSYITISNYYRKSGIVTINPTHKIRLYVYNKSEEKPKNLDSEKVLVLKTTFDKFIVSLLQEKFDEAKNFLSEKITNTVSLEILKELKKNIRSSEMKVFMSGIQFIDDGNSYPMIQFQFSDDFNNPPKDLIAVLFDEENKIIGIRPIRRE